MAIDKVRLEIPPDLGGGWVEVRERRGWAARNRLISAGVTYREGVTESDLASARTGGEVGSYIEPDTAGKAVVLVETGIAAISWSRRAIRPSGLGDSTRSVAGPS